MNPVCDMISVNKDGSLTAIDFDNQGGMHTRTLMITPAKQPKPFPHMGQTCVIRHQVKRASNGDVLGLNRADRDTREVITAVYIDGLVRTGTSDVWDVKPAGMNTWETINPNHGKSE